MEKQPKSIVYVGVLLLAFIVCAVWFFNSGYGETSEQGYQYAVALYSTCNQRDANRLEKVAGLIAQAHDKGEISAAEQRWLSGIIRQGRDGDWDAASQAVRDLMKEQVQRAPAFTDE